MLDSSWSDLAFKEGEQIVGDSGQIKVVRLSEFGPVIANADEADSRFSLRYMLFHPEFFDWREKFSPSTRLVMSDVVPATLLFPRGPVSFVTKQNSSAPVLSKDFHLKKSVPALFHNIVKCGDFWRCPLENKGGFSA